MTSPPHTTPRALIATCFGLVLLAGCAPHTRRPIQSTAAPEAIATPVVAIESRQIKAIEPLEIQTDRYSYIAARPSPEQINPLLTVIDVRIPRDILTVEQAAEYLLQRSGYNLSKGDTAVLYQVIPDVHRHLGPMTLQDALLTLGGQAFRLAIDPVNRLVAYEIDPRYQIAGGKP